MEILQVHINVLCVHCLCVSVYAMEKNDPSGVYECSETCFHTSFDDEYTHLVLEVGANLLYVTVTHRTLKNDFLTSPIILRLFFKFFFGGGVTELSRTLCSLL